jgi:hypothetical protein
VEEGGRERAFPLAVILEDPRARAAGIPLFLWVCAAVVAHLAGGGGAFEAAKIAEERAELRAAVRAERAGLRPSTTEIELLTDNTEPLPQKVEPLKDDLPGEAKSDGEADPDAPKPDALPKPPPPKPEAKTEPPKPEPPKVEPPKPEAPKPEPPKPIKPLAPVEAPAAPPPPPPPPPPPIEPDRRIAVRQFAKPNQDDNPTANRIADDANKVDKETMAKARANDMDSPKPSMGSAKPGGPKDEVGNDKDVRSGSAEEHKGDKDHAPGERKADSSASEHETPRPPVPPTPRPGPPPSVPASQGKGAVGAAPQPAGPRPSPGGAGPASPEVTAGDKGSYSLDPANPGGDGKTRLPGRKRPPNAFQSPVHVGALGLGGAGMPGGPQINLDMPGVERAVGNEQLKKERAADGAARLAHHRGQGPKNKFEKFRAAIENYEPSVELGNTTALNAARVPFATYLNTIHNRIHPIFAEEYLEFYNSRPKTERVNDLTIFTSLEIVLDKTTGKIVRMGVTKTSGITEYDLTALASVDRAGPFGKAPDVIASPDGNVYLHWEFHRDDMRCSNINAFPYVLKEGETPKAPEPLPVPKPPMKPGPEDGKKFGMLPSNKTDG